MNDFKPIQTSQMPRAEKLKNAVWTLVNKTLFRITPPHFGVFRKFRVLLLRSFGADVSFNASIHPSANIDFPWRLNVGDDSSIGKNAWLYCLNNITIGKATCIGQEVYLLTGSHDISSSHFDLVTKPITIGDGVWIATSSAILPGVTLSDMTVVAAGSVVIKNTEANDVVGGNPAKFIKKREIVK